jgi:hypothetical protein
MSLQRPTVKFRAEVFKEGDVYVAVNPELSVPALVKQSMTRRALCLKRWRASWKSASAWARWMRSSKRQAFIRTPRRDFGWPGSLRM